VIEYLIKKNIHEFQVNTTAALINQRILSTPITNEGPFRWAVSNSRDAYGYSQDFNINSINHVLVNFPVGQNIIRLGWITPNVHFYSIPKVIDTDCGFEDVNLEIDADRKINGSSWALNCEHWVEDDWLSTSIGAVSKTYKKGFLGIWYPKNAEQISVVFGGDIVDWRSESRPDVLGSSIACQNIRINNFLEIEANSSYVERNKGDMGLEINRLVDDPAVRKNRLFSTHKARVSGVTWGIDNLTFK
jgi:hypothetical protein